MVGSCIVWIIGWIIGLHKKVKDHLGKKEINYLAFYRDCWIIIWVIGRSISMVINSILLQIKRE